MIQDVSEFLGCETNVERKQHGAGFENTIISFEQPVAIQAEKCDAVSRRDASILQRTAQPRSAIGKFPVSKPLVPTYHGSPMRILLFRISQAPQRCEGTIHCAARLA